MTKVTRMTQKLEHHEHRTRETADAPTNVVRDRGPMRTLKVGDRITVYGDLEVIAVDGRHVQVRVVRPSSPPPEPVMFPASGR